MSKMNPEVKARWVAALRSGKYKQGQGVLQSPTGEMCCLGVLCDVLDPKGWASESEDGIAISHFSVDDLPDDVVRQQAGFSEIGRANKYANRFVIPEVNIGGDMAALHDHNDAGRTFAEIADAIEEQL